MKKIIKYVYCLVFATLGSILDSHSENLSSFSLQDGATKWYYFWSDPTRTPDHVTNTMNGHPPSLGWSPPTQGWSPIRRKYSTASKFGN